MTQEKHMCSTHILINIESKKICTNVNREMLIGESKNSCSLHYLWVFFANFLIFNGPFSK